MAKIHSGFASLGAAAFLMATQLIPSSSCKEIPENLQAFYDEITSSGSGKCSDELADDFYSTDAGGKDYAYCGDHLDEWGIVYLTGTASSDGPLVNMDVDCDGISNEEYDDGRCKSSTDTQHQTSFGWIIEDYDVGDGLKELDANVHPYVVFGNQGERKGFANYDPKDDFIKPLSVMAVVCNNQLVYGIWGDYNGDDGAKSLVGEASISLASLCYGDDAINGGHGHEENDVLYIAFTGKSAVPGSNGANWTASDAEAFEESISSLGDQLVSRIGAERTDWFVPGDNDRDEYDDDSAAPEWYRKSRRTAVFASLVVTAVFGSSWLSVF